MGTFTVSGDLGSLADWAAVFVAVTALVVAAFSAVVALVGAAAVAYLGWQANRQVSHMDKSEKRVSQREADLLMILLEAEIGMFGVSLRSFVKYLENDGKYYETNADVRRSAADRVAELVIPDVDANFDRLHVLPDEVGYSFARLKGILTALRITVEVGRDASDEQAKGVHSAISETSRKLVLEAGKLEAATNARRKQLVPNIP